MDLSKEFGIVHGMETEPYNFKLSTQCGIDYRVSSCSQSAGFTHRIVAHTIRIYTQSNQSLRVVLPDNAHIFRLIGVRLFSCLLENSAQISEETLKIHHQHSIDENSNSSIYLLFSSENLI